MIDASLMPADASSRSEFVEKAIRYYAASLLADMHKEILSEELIRVIRDNIKNAENHIASTLFKMAGEQAVLNLLIADKLIGEIGHDEIRAYRNDAYNTVRKWHGVFTFDDALENAEAVSESEDD